MAGAVPAPISYVDMLAMADGVLRLNGRARDLFFMVIEAADAAVLSDVNKRFEKKGKEEEGKK